MVSKRRLHHKPDMPKTHYPTISLNPSITYPYVPSPIVSVRLKLLIVRVPQVVDEEDEEDDETVPKALPRLPPATGPPAMALAV